MEAILSFMYQPDNTESFAVFLILGAVVVAFCLGVFLYGMATRNRKP